MNINMFNNINYLEKVLDIRAYNHTVIGSNIANQETPNYKAVELDFEQTLKQTVGDINPMKMNASLNSHLEGVGFHTKIAPALKINSNPSLNNDLNTVDLDEELGKMGRNAMFYRIVSKLVSNRFSNLRGAISEGGRD